MKHFGITVWEGKLGLKLNREHYAIPNPQNTFGGESYSIEWCEHHKKECLENFDLNMQFFASLNHEIMERELQNFLIEYPGFLEVDDLRPYSNIAGYYIMVLDDYCQLYIGTTSDIKERIWQHWTFQRSFDRLIFGDKHTSKLSIDSFRAFDTTRIFVSPTEKTFDEESKYIKFFSNMFLCNRLSGGKRPGNTMRLDDLITMNRNLLKTGNANNEK